VEKRKSRFQPGDWVSVLDDDLLLQPSFGHCLNSRAWNFNLYGCHYFQQLLKFKIMADNTMNQGGRQSESDQNRSGNQGQSGSQESQRSNTGQSGSRESERSNMGNQGQSGQQSGQSGQKQNISRDQDIDVEEGERDMNKERSSDRSGSSDKSGSGKDRGRNM
jgi:hypothetical protein